MLPFTRVPRFGRFEVQRDLALLVVLVAACAAPFLGQPFHMDDTFYLDMAQNARSKPLHPNDTPYVFEGRRLADMGSHSHPPLVTWYLALAGGPEGGRPGSEWRYHVAMLPFPVLAVLACYFLAARFLERPLWPALGLAAAPLVQVTQHTLMTDVPMLAFWLGAAAAFVWGVELDRPALWAASALALSAAVLVGYQALALVVLLGWYQLRGRGGRCGWWALLAPIAVLAAWFAIGYLHYHRFILADTLGFMGSRRPIAWSSLGTKLAAVLGYQGWLLVCPPFLLHGTGRALRGRLLPLAGLASLYLAAAFVHGYSAPEMAIFAVGLTIGACVAGRVGGLGLALVRGRSEAAGFAARDAELLVLWYFGVLFYCVFVLPEGSARYILPLAPPVLILFFRGLELAEASEYRTRPALGSGVLASGAVILSLFWGAALAHADLEFARLYPRAAREAARLVPPTPAYEAGEWGFRRYFQGAGFDALPLDDSRVRGGSTLALPTLALPYELPRGLGSMLMPFASVSCEPATPLRLLDRRSHAGFYSTGWGLLAFSLSRRPLERIELSQVNFMVERLPWAVVTAPPASAPWPGYLGLAGERPLAILARPGTMLSYAWEAREALRLDLRCGIALDGYAPGDPSEFAFDVLQRDAAGSVRARTAARLAPGLRGADARWHALSLALEPSGPAGGALEFRYSGPAGSNALGAFASSTLRRLP